MGDIAPLKGKTHHVQTNARLDDSIPLGQTCYVMFHHEEVKGAVTWLKDRVPYMVDSYSSGEKIMKLIDEAFEDVTGDEE